MNRNEALTLPVGTKVRGKLYTDSRWSHGTVVESSHYGKGIRFDGYRYIFAEDCHDFASMSARLLESIEVVKNVNIR